MFIAFYTNYYTRTIYLAPIDNNSVLVDIAWLKS